MSCGVVCCAVLWWCRHSNPQVDADEVRKLKRVDAAEISKKNKLTEMDVLAVVKNDSTYLEVRRGGGRQSSSVWV